MEVSEVQSLTSRVDALNQSVDSWNGVMLVALLFAAAAAFAVLITTRIVITKAKQLAEAQGQLIKIKDNQLTLDLRNKDEKIVAALADAARANEETAKAKLEQERIKAQIAFRRLSKEQHDRLVTLITGRSFKVEVSSPLGDAEAAIFSLELERALKDGGLQVSSSINQWSTPPLGLFIAGDRNDDFKLLVDAFGKIGLQGGFGPEKGALQIIVGSKPSQF